MCNWCTHCVWVLFYGISWILNPYWFRIRILPIPYLGIVIRMLKISISPSTSPISLWQRQIISYNTEAYETWWKWGQVHPQGVSSGGIAPTIQVLLATPKLVNNCKQHCSKHHATTLRLNLSIANEYTTLRWFLEHTSAPNADSLNYGHRVAKRWRRLHVIWRHRLVLELVQARAQWKGRRICSIVGSKPKRLSGWELVYV